MTQPLPNTERVLVCYRYQAWAHDYDVEAVWDFVQRNQGHISIRQDSVDFWVTPSVATLFVMAYPDLIRQPDLDYV